jgi:hypothetical protein
VYAGYFNWASGGLSPLHWWLPTPAPVGTVVCKNGSTTGSSCGTVENNAVQVQYNDGTWLSNMLMIKGMCLAGGDSGSPVTMASQETAVGILSGGWSDQCVSLATGIGDAMGHWPGLQIYGFPV